ncbi:MAG: hypothetical protein ACRD8O_06805 [Bryobacteraceae bacterium]
MVVVPGVGAYRGYFQDDDLDTLSWAAYVPESHFWRNLFDPIVQNVNFRPAGGYYYHAIARVAGLKFGWYVAVLQALHALNTLMVWRLLARLGVKPWPALAGAAFFAFHPACFDAYWRPMFVFDVLCATFSMACLLAWMERRWAISLLSFWLAYRSKELAIALPLVLAAYEFRLGERKWKPLIPFLAVSFSFGIQAILLNRGQRTPYSLDFSGKAIWTTARYYAGELGFPFAGMILAGVAALLRDRRAWLGAAGFWVLLGPMLALPGRQISVYLYVPLALAAVVVAVTAEKTRWVWPALAGWLVFSAWALPPYAAKEIAMGEDHRRFVGTLREFVHSHPEIQRYFYESIPASLRPWGISGALMYVCREVRRTENPCELDRADDSRFQPVAHDQSAAVLAWDAAQRRMVIISGKGGDAPAARIRMDTLTPVWQLRRGWYGREGTFRWMQPEAEVRLQKPEGATRFRMELVVPVAVLGEAKQRDIEVFLDERSLGRVTVLKTGQQKVDWKAPAGRGGPVSVRIVSKPGMQDPYEPREIAVAVEALGFE